MATLNHAESRRLYSWWWDSHISPKNSKWLQENLADMDSNVKAMIRLIEEDAESFAQRAEMFYKKRPELMKLVEEFYRAYRALAERYDHATGALRQAHRKMAEAFPNEIPLEFSDEPPSVYSSSDAGPDILEMNIGLFLPDDLRHVLPTSKITLKQLQDMFTTGELTEELKFQDDEGKRSECKLLRKENHDLKNKIISEMARADESESEVHCLKEDCNQANLEKEDAASRCKEAKERITYLEYEISCMQADLEKINHADERCLTLEKANQVLISEVEHLNRRIREQQKELEKKEDDLQKLGITLNDEQQGRIKCEMACHSYEKQLVECQKKLKDTQLGKASLEEALQKSRWENGKLNEEKLSSALKIINLQDDIISFRSLKGKLQAELNIQLEEKAAIQQELNCLKEDRNDLKKKYHALMEEIQVINSNVQFLQAMIRELRDGNFELKETIKKHENEKYNSLNLQYVGKISEKNATLKNTISDVNNELERLREQIRTLEDSCYYLHGRVSINQAEKARLISHVEAVSNNMEKISSEKTFLENSLSDMNTELDALRGKLKSLEESSKTLHDEKSSLLLEKFTLVSQVESISQSLKNLERRYSALEEKHSNLQEEKNSTQQQVEEIQELLKLEREEHNEFLQSSNSQLSALVNQIQHFQVENQRREEELELEQIKIMNAQIEIFVLQKCLRDMKEENLILSIGSQKHQETLRCSEKLISELEEECVAQENKIKSLTEHNENLRGWIHLLIHLLKIDLENISLDDIKDEVLMQLILREIRHLLCAISEAQEEKQHLLLEKSVVVSLLKQFGAYIEDLRAEKAALERESKKRNEDLDLLKNKNDEFFKKNKQLKEASQAREKSLKAELDILYQQLSDLQDAHCLLQIKVSNMHEENHIVSNKLHHMRHEQDKLEKENSVLISDVMALDCFSSILQSLISEKGFELQLSSNERNQLHKAQKDLDEEITLINRKITLLQAESPHASESIPELERCSSLDEERMDGVTNMCKKMNLKIYTRRPFTDENMNLSGKNTDKQLERKDTHKDCSYLDLDVNVLKQDKEEDAACKGTDVLYVCHENNILKGEVNELQKDSVLRRREQCLASTNKNRTNEQSSCDKDITSVMADSSLITTNAESFQAKVHDLIKTWHTFEQKTMMQMHALQGEITQSNLIINEQKKKLNVLEKENKELKADLNAYLLLLRSLWDDISLLEEQTVSLTKRHTSTKNQRKKDVQVKSFTKRSQESSENYNASKTPGPVKLLDLLSKIKILQKVVMDTGRLLELERLDSTNSMDSAWNEIERLPSKECQQQVTAKMKSGQVMKDVQLDFVLNSSCNRNSDLSGMKAKRAEQSIDDVFEVCRTSEESCSNHKQKASFFVPKDDTTGHHHVGVDDGDYALIELVAEKELAVDKLVLSTKPESYQEWSRRVVQRLSSDGHRLLVLQACVRELQKNIEEFVKINHPVTSELEPIKEQLKEAEGSISKLIDVNHKLISKVEYFPVPLDSLIDEKKGDGSLSRKQITDQARKVSEKIARLEVEMQKIQYSIPKTDEEGDTNRAKVVDQRSGILLKEYIYGKRNSRRQKKGSCGCIRPKTNGD